MSTRALRGSSVIVEEAVEHGDRKESSAIRRRLAELGIRDRDCMDALVNAGPVIVGKELVADASDVFAAEEEEMVEGFPAERAVEALDVGARVGCAVGDLDSADPEGLEEPAVEGGAVRSLLAGRGIDDRDAGLSVLGVAVVDQEARLCALGGGFTDLLLDPREGRVVGGVPVDDASGFDLHDEEEVEGLEPDRVLGEEIAGPDFLEVVLHEGAPRGGRRAAGRARVAGRHVPADRGRRVMDPELEGELLGDPVLAPLRAVNGAVATIFRLGRNSFCGWRLREWSEAG
jgi:hypothetical protein